MDQLNKLLEDQKDIENVIKTLIGRIFDECTGMLSRLDTFNDKPYSKNDPESVNRRGKAKWVFEKTELEYLRARVESMKANILLMTTLHSMRKPGRCAH